MKQVRITLCMLLLCLLCGCAKSTVTPNWAKQTTKPADKTAATKDTQSSGWQEQYDLGVRYLSDGNYEDAIIAFTAAIEIDPKKPQAYDKLATAYERAGDDEAALRTLLDGAAATGDRALTARAEEKQKTLEDPTDRPASEMLQNAAWMRRRQKPTQPRWRSFRKPRWTSGAEKRIH